MFSDKIIKLFKNNVTPVYIIIAILTLLIGLLNPVIFDAFVRAAIGWRILISVILIALPTFFMGIPFPYGIRHIMGNDNTTRYLVAFSWGVNGFFSVIGSILVVMLSMSYGFRIVFIIAALIYLTAMYIAVKFEPIKRIASN